MVNNASSQLLRLWLTSHQITVNSSTQSKSTTSRQLPW